MNLIKPSPSEQAPYFARYINLVESDCILDYFKSQRDSFASFLSDIPVHKADFAYGENKWTIKQVLNHINDVERVFSFRAMALSRNEQNPILGFDHNEYVEQVDVSNRTIDDLKEEFIAIRNSTIQFYENMPDQYATRQGIVSNHNTSVRAMAFMTAGHVIHHQIILKERYL